MLEIHQHPQVQKWQNSVDFSEKNPFRVVETVEQFIEDDVDTQTLLSAHELVVDVVSPMPDNIKTKITKRFTKSELRQSFREFYR
jgi:hypothetical protein